MSDCSFIPCTLNISQSGYGTVWLLHGRCHMKLLPSRCKFCVHHTTMHQFTLPLYSKPQQLQFCSPDLIVRLRKHHKQNSCDWDFSGRGGEVEYSGYTRKQRHTKVMLSLLTDGWLRGKLTLRASQHLDACKEVWHFPQLTVLSLRPPLASVSSGNTPPESRPIIVTQMRWQTTAMATASKLLTDTLLHETIQSSMQIQFIAILNADKTNSFSSFPV